MSLRKQGSSFFASRGNQLVRAGLWRLIPSTGSANPRAPSPRGTSRRHRLLRRTRLSCAPPPPRLCRCLSATSRQLPSPVPFPLGPGTRKTAIASSRLRAGPCRNLSRNRNPRHGRTATGDQACLLRHRRCSNTRPISLTHPPVISRAAEGTGRQTRTRISNTISNQEGEQMTTALRPNRVRTRSSRKRDPVLRAPKA